MEAIAPGSILQRMYFKKRLNGMKPGRFCEIGSGHGVLSRVLLSKGWSGIGLDLGEDACRVNRQMNADYIAAKKYSVKAGNFLNETLPDTFDLVVAMMVIEHLSQDELDAFVNRCKEILAPQGRIVFFVPGSMKYWGIEDEIAGHYKRYEFADFDAMAKKFSLNVADLCGLTYPVSNLIFPVSNYLVKKGEGHKKELSAEQQTIDSGNRSVLFKTSFPIIMKLVLNEVVMYPFYILQRIFKKHSSSMVLYCELTKRN